MKDISVSARTISGTVGLVACYSISIYFFWDSQMAINGFKIDPEYSYVSKALYPLIGRDNAKPVAIALAFLSIHMSWTWRYVAGDIIGKIWRKFSPNKTPEKITTSASQDLGSIKNMTVLEDALLITKNDHCENSVVLKNIENDNNNKS